MVGEKCGLTVLVLVNTQSIIKAVATLRQMRHLPRQTFYNAATKHFCNATSNHITAYCVAVLKRVALQLHCVTMTRDTTSLD